MHLLLELNEGKSAEREYGIEKREAGGERRDEKRRRSRRERSRAHGLKTPMCTLAADHEERLLEKMDEKGVVGVAA